nr:putative reverse transcriptase domain-containing protein [Tanacetum cinerariifolium]
MVAFLSKSDASASFDQIVDFLNAQVIQYALMVNPTIYVSCIKQFWATVSIKKANDVVKLQALIDRNKVVVTEDVIRHDLRLDNDDGVEIAWNEFSCSMASAIICLASGRKINFSKYIFDSMYTSPALTQKVFANIRRVSKGFFGVETPLFATMLVQPQPPATEEEDEVEGRKIEAIDADDEITLVDMETQDDLGVVLQGRKDDDNATIKVASDAEPTVFDDEENKLQPGKSKKKMIWKNLKCYNSRYKMKHFRGMTYDKESFKKLKAVEVLGSHSIQDTPTDDPKEISKEDVKNMLEIIPVYEFKVEALQVNAKLQVEEDSEMARDLVMKIFIEANKPKSRISVSHIVGLDLSKSAIILYRLKKIHSKGLTLAKVRKVAYRLELTQELSRVHYTFHVSNLKKCYADKPLAMLLEGIHVDDKLQFVDEPIEIMER